MGVCTRVLKSRWEHLLSSSTETTVKMMPLTTRGMRTTAREELKNKKMTSGSRCKREEAMWRSACGAIQL